MFKLQSRDKDLLQTILYFVVAGGATLFLIHALGEIHGCILAVLLLVVQLGFLTTRVSALERELRSSRESHGPSKPVEKII